MMENILAADTLVKTFDDLTAVDGVSFTIAEGETFGLLGPNGAGKTTTISMVCGLLTADSGSVVVAGEEIRNGGQVLYADPDNNGLSLGCYSFPANFTFPLHFHDSDQIILVNTVTAYS